MAEIRPEEIENPDLVIVIVRGSNGQAKRVYPLHEGAAVSPDELFDMIGRRARRANRERDI